MHAQVKALLFRALDLPHEHRRDWILANTESRPEIRREALELLEEADQLDHFLTKGPGFDLEEIPASARRVEPSMPSSVAGIRIRRPLGFGGMGIVYLGEQEQPRRRVAVKVLHEVDAEASVSARFRREIEILGKLRHPGIARIHEAGRLETATGGASWFSMDYIDGATLGEYAKREQPSREELAGLVARIADIVEYAHGLGVLHRDLKPGNILIDASGDPHLLDFGVARLLDEERLLSLHTVTGAVIGTIAYMSPEQARGAEVDARADVFSLGAVFYELLTGKLPFESRGRSLEQLVRSVAEDEPTALSRHDASLAGDLEAVVHTAIDTDPHRRYATMAEFRDDLRRWIEHRPVHARKRTFLDRGRKFVRRNRMVVTAAAILFLVLSTALLVSLRSLREARRAGESSQRALADVVGFSRGYSIDDMVARGAELWPAGPATLDGLRALLSEARRVVADIPEARAHLRGLRAFEVEGGLSQRFGGELDGRWVLRMQELLVERMEALEEGMVVDLEERIAFAEEVVGELESSRDLWRRTAASVAANPFYGGLVLEPQVGLRPLGADVDSGLEEFALLVPGCAIPARNATTGRLQLADDSTIVLVLLPGGPVRVGCQGEDPAAAFYDPYASEFRWPVTDRELLPFLVSKFEVTQHQWRSLTGESPSYWRAGKQYESYSITVRHPVESVPWVDALEFARKLGLTLPTEVQFEYAARGGSTAATWWGASDHRDPDRVNLLRSTPGSRDVYRLHAPVGTFPANGFGLHEVTGNLAELCLDDYKLYPSREPYREGDALVLADGGGEQSLRGSNYDEVQGATLSQRGDIKKDGRSRTVGLRPVRYLAGRSPVPSKGGAR